MAGKSSSANTPARKAAGAPRPRKAAAPAPACSESANAPEDLLRASLKAFRLERLMGWVPAKAGAREGALPGVGFPGLDGFGFRKFEDVLDQRVAGALQRLGWPDAETLGAMQAEIERLKGEVEQLRQALRKPAASKPAGRGRRAAG